MRITQRILFVLALLSPFAATPAIAQPTTSVELKLYFRGATSPFQTSSLAWGGFSCGQPKVAAPPGTVANPSRVQLDDPADTTKACTYTDPGTGPLLSLPFNAQEYFATSAFVNSAGKSSESVASNFFSRPGAAPATAPTGLVVR